MLDGTKIYWHLALERLVFVDRGHGYCPLPRIWQATVPEILLPR